MTSATTKKMYLVRYRENDSIEGYYRHKVNAETFVLYDTGCSIDDQDVFYIEEVDDCGSCVDDYYDYDDNYQHFRKSVLRMYELLNDIDTNDTDSCAVHALIERAFERDFHIIHTQSADMSRKTLDVVIDDAKLMTEFHADYLDCWGILDAYNIVLDKYDFE